MKVLLFLFLGTTLFFSQGNRFVYEVTCKKDSTSELHTTENFNLDVTESDIAYYNRIYYMNDSVFSAKNIYGGFKGYKLTSFLIKKKNDNIYQNYEYIGDVNFYKLSEDAKQQWNITDSIKISNNLSLQKATTRFGGRSWVAWFSKDIPIPYGSSRVNYGIV